MKIGRQNRKERTKARKGSKIKAKKLSRVRNEIAKESRRVSIRRRLAAKRRSLKAKNKGK